MRSVKIARSDLLLKVEENRKEHIETYFKALEGYREEAIKKLRFMLDQAERGEKIQRQLDLTEPVNCQAAYESLIAMLKFSADEVIELSETEFKQYVLDEWGWKQQFTASTAAYIQ